MRTHNSAFGSLNTETVREPRFVIEFDFGGEDYHYFTSHPIDGLSGANVTDGVLTRVDSTSQKLDPDKANSKIGSMTVRIADEGLTELQQAKLSDDKGLRNKRVRYYAGFAELSWSSFTLVQTQLIQGASYKEQEYTFKCADIQRQMREDIFALKETTLSASLTADATEIQVYSVNGLNLVQQPVSPTGRTLASGKKICLVRIEGDNDAFEIAMAEEIDESTNTLKQVTRGVLGTNPLEIEVDPDEKRDNAPKVTEYVYLDMPAPMLAYALLTGSIYGYPGEYLPDHWHMGVGPEFIRTSEYQNIGADLWDLNDFDAGLSVVLAGVEKESGKKFVEEQVFRLMGCYPPIYSDGQIGLRRMTLIPSQSGYSRVLNEGNVLKAATLEHDMGGMINDILVFWNWNQRKEAFTRVNRLLDSGSIERNGQSETLEIEFRGLTAERHTYTTIKNILDSLRDRYAGPPLRTSLELSPENNDLEVGDIVRVNLAGVKDYSTDQVDVTLNRNFEVQQVKVDWQTGKVTVDLFGSSQRASELPVDQFGSALPLSWYQSEGTEISAANFPGAVLEEAGERRITADITLAGHASIADDTAIYWCPEDLTIDGGVTVTLTKNVQLRVAGYFQNNGTIDGRGKGQAGGAGIDQITVDPTYLAKYVKWEAANKGLPGYLRSESMPQPDGVIWQTNNFDDYRWVYSSAFNRFESGVYNFDLPGSFSSLEPIGGVVISAARAGLDASDGSLKGLPDYLWGGSGHGGGCVSKTPAPQLSSDGLTYLGPGTDGGDSGAGLAIICRGFAIGDNGLIDLSGGDAAAPPNFYQATSWARAYPGTGAPGGPGALYFVMDGETAIPGDITGSNFLAFYGEAPVPGFQGVRGSNQLGFMGAPLPGVYRYYEQGDNDILSPLLSPQPTALNVWQSAYVVHQLTGSIPVTPDIPEDTVNPVSVTVAELTNTPRSANANLSTIEVSVQPPSVSSYKYALVEYREKGQQGWFEVGPASPEVGFVVPSDGKTYEIRARGASLSGNVVPDAPIQEITTTKVLNAEPGDQDVDDVVEVPNVHGLELFEQGNDAVFGGRDAKFVWRKTSVTEWLEMGSEGQLGASRGSLDLYFKDYQVEVWAGGSLARTEWVVDPAFVYTYEKNAEDYARELGQAGAWRAFECRVYCRGRQNQLSAQAAKLAVENVAPELPDAITVSASFRSLQIDYDPPEDLDYKETRVWLSQSEGFTPGPANQVAQAYGGPVVIAGLADNTEYFLRFATYDAFGQGSVSQEFSVTTPSLAAAEVEGLSPWATVTDADKAFIDANLDDNAIEGTKIVKLTASKIVTGTLAATEKISVAGQVESVVGDAVATLGPKSADSKTGMITYQYDGVTLFAVYSDGSAAFSGAVTITEGSGYANLSDKPASLNDINGSEYSQLGQASADAAQALADAADAQAAADGKVTSFYQASAPTADGVGDLWVDSDTDRLYRWDGSTWVEIQDQGIGQALTDAAAAQGTADSKIVTFYQTGAPVAGAVGDLWVDTDDGNRLYRWNGSTWQDVHDAAIDQALSAAAAAQSTADGKIQSFYQNGEPSSGMSEGDLWFDTDDGNHPYRFNGSTWVDAQDSGISQALSDASDAQATADGKVTTFFATSEPTAEGIGDLWYNDSTKVMKRWNGTSWVDTATAGANWNSNLQNIPSRLGDTPTAGLNLTATHLGYYDGTNWRAFIENDGTFYFGDGDQKYLKFDGTDFTAGRETTLIGVDSYNGRKLYVHDNFLTAFVPDDNFSVVGGGSAALNRGRYSLWLETSGNGDKVDFYHYAPRYIIDQAEASSNFRMKVGFSFRAAANGIYGSGDSVNTVMNMKLFSCRDSGANFCQAQYEIESDWVYSGSGDDREWTETHRVRLRQGATTETRTLSTVTVVVPRTTVIVAALGQFYGVECFVDLENDEVTISTPEGNETFSLTSTYTINDFNPGDALKVSMETTGNKTMEAEAHLSDFYFMQE